MSNLLPKEEKKYLRREYAMRRLIVSLFFLFIILVIGIVFSLPSYIILVLRERSFARDLEFAQQLSDRYRMEAEVPILQIAAEQLNVLEQEKMDIMVNVLFQRIVEEREDDVVLSRLSISKQTEGDHLLEVEGIAPTRRRLIGFSKDIETIPGIESVNLPISDLAQGTDIEFSFEVKGKFQDKF